MASGITLDHFYRSGLTATSLAAAWIIFGMEDLTIAGGIEMLSYAYHYGRPLRDA